MRSLTVAICSYQRREAVTAQVAELNELAAAEPEAWVATEILVVLDGSTDGSAVSLAAISSLVPLRVISQTHTGLAGARNRCITEANGDVIWFLDDDLLPLPGTIGAHRAIHEHTRDVGVLGPCLLPEHLGVSEDGRRWWAERDKKLERSPQVPVEHFSTANFSVDLSVMRVLGGFDESFVGYGYEDNEIGCRLTDAGIHTQFRSTAPVWHNSTIDEAKSFERQRELGRNLVLLLQRHPALLESFEPSMQRSRRTILRSLPSCLYWPLAITLYRLTAVVLRPRRVRQLLHSLAWDSAFAAGVSEQQSQSLSMPRRKRAHGFGRMRSSRVFIAPLGSPRPVAAAYHVLRLAWGILLTPLRQWYFSRTTTLCNPRYTELSKRRIPAADRPCVFLAIYRHRNADAICTLIAAAGDLNLDIRLWALDTIHPALRDFTVGAGPGGKYDLLNRLCKLRPARPDSWWIIADDDVVLTRQARLRELLATMEENALDVAQPAHSWCSAATYWLTFRRPWSIARVTCLVEIGPLLALDPRAAALMLPFPPHSGMGWSIQADWYLLARNVLRFGIVDSIAMIHRDLPNHSYDWKLEHDRFAERASNLGLDLDEYEASLTHATLVRRRRLLGLSRSSTSLKAGS